MKRTFRGAVARSALVLILIATVMMSVRWIGPRLASATPSGRPAPPAAPPAAPPRDEPPALGGPPVVPTRAVETTAPLPQFAGRVIHYSTVSMSYSPWSPDVNNGKRVTGDVWLRIDATGFVEEFVGLYRNDAGEVTQTQYENAQHERVAFGHPLLTDPRGVTICGSDTRTADSRPQKNAPSSRQPSEVLKDGYVEQPAVFNGPIPQGARTFVEQVSGANGSTTRRALALDATGRLVGWRSITTDGSGTRTAETSSTKGAIEVAPSASIPAEIIEVALGMPIEGCK